jgi:S1-C subfamily serine protease
VKLGVWRAGQSLELTAVITESGISGTSAAQAPRGTTQGRTRDVQEILQAIGIEVRDLSVPERMQGFRGVVVTGLAPNGLAANQLKPGDMIMAVNNTHISGANEFFLNLAGSAAVQDTTLYVVRAEKVLRVIIPAIPRKD